MILVTQLEPVCIIIAELTECMFNRHTDIFVAMSSDLPKQKHGHPRKPKPDVGSSMSKQPRGRPRKAADPDQPVPAPRPVGRPPKHSVFIPPSVVSASF